MNIEKVSYHSSVQAVATDSGGQMDETLWHKFAQHRNLRIELLETGDAELIEVNISLPL